MTWFIKLGGRVWLFFLRIAVPIDAFCRYLNFDRQKCVMGNKGSLCWVCFTRLNANCLCCRRQDRTTAGHPGEAVRCAVGEIRVQRGQHQDNAGFRGSGHQIPERHADREQQWKPGGGHEKQIDKWIPVLFGERLICCGIANVSSTCCENWRRMWWFCKDYQLILRRLICCWTWV